MSVIGSIATLLTVSSILPQLHKTYKSKLVGHLSIVQMLILYIGIACWLYYGVLIENYTIVLANSISLFLQTLLIGMKIKYGKTK